MTNRYTALTVILLLLLSFCACVSYTCINVLKLQGSIETTTISGDSIRRISLVGDVTISGTFNVAGVRVVDLRQCRSLKIEGEFSIKGNSRAVTRVLLPHHLLIKGSGKIALVNSDVFADQNEPMLSQMKRFILPSSETGLPPLPIGNSSEYSKLHQDVSAITNRITWLNQEEGGNTGHLTLHNSVVLVSCKFEKEVTTEIHSTVLLGKHLEMSVVQCVNSRLFEQSGRLSFSGRVKYTELSGGSYVMFANCKMYGVLLRSNKEGSYSSGRRACFKRNNTINTLVVCGRDMDIIIRQEWKCSNAIFLGNHDVELSSSCTNADIQNCMWITVPDVCLFNAGLSFDKMIIYARKTNKVMRKLTANNCLLINGYFVAGMKKKIAGDMKISLDIHDIYKYFNSEEKPVRNGKYSLVKKVDGTYEWSQEEMKSREIKKRLSQHFLYGYILTIVKDLMPEILPHLPK